MRSLLLVVSVVALASPADASFVVNTFDRGNYDNAGGHVTTNDNYITGYVGGTATFRRSFFAFDLTGIDAATNVAVARLRLFLPLTPNNGYASAGASETFVVSDVTTPVTDLTGALGNNTLATYADLGTGVTFGTAVVRPADAGTTVVITLNPAGRAAIQAAIGGRIAFGGSLSTIALTPPSTNNELVFGFTSTLNPNDGRTQLEIQPAPAPLTLVAGLVGAAGLAVGRRRR